MFIAGAQDFKGRKSARPRLPGRLPGGGVTLAGPRGKVGLGPGLMVEEAGSEEDGA